MRLRYRYGFAGSNQRLSITRYFRLRDYIWTEVSIKTKIWCETLRIVVSFSLVKISCKKTPRPRWVFRNCVHMLAHALWIANQIKTSTKKVTCVNKKSTWAMSVFLRINFLCSNHNLGVTVHITPLIGWGKTLSPVWYVSEASMWKL